MEDTMFDKAMLDTLAGEVNAKRKGEGPPKRYIMFLQAEWDTKINKPLGAVVQPEQAKTIITNLLAKLASGEWKLDTGKPK